MRGTHVGVMCVMLLSSAVVGDAHFKLLEPASWLVSNDRGDPQKAAPCGGDAKDKGTPSNIVGSAVGGQKLRLRVLETIYHPGHYRVALAVNSRDISESISATGRAVTVGLRIISTSFA